MNQESHIMNQEDNNQEDSVDQKRNTDTQSEFDPLADADLLVEILRAFVLHPEDVKVDEQPGDPLNLTIHLHPEDVRIVVGREHGTIYALRHIFSKIGAANQGKTFLHIAGSGPTTGFNPRPNNQRQRFRTNNNNVNRQYGNSEEPARQYGPSVYRRHQAR